MLTWGLAVCGLVAVGAYAYEAGRFAFRLYGVLLDWYERYFCAPGGFARDSVIVRFLWGIAIAVGLAWPWPRIVMRDPIQAIADAIARFERDFAEARATAG